jgi:acyl carrier protein
VPVITQEIRDEVKEIVYNFFSEECEIDRESINSATKVIEDLEGDSLMFLELLELFKKKYKLDFRVQSIGQYMLKHPAETVAKVIDLTLLVIEHEDKIAELD